MPVDATGYTPRSTADILEEVQTELRENISEQLDLSDKTVLGNVTQILSPKFTDLEELAEEAYNAYDVDNATDDRQVALQLLRGIERRGPQTGLADVTVNLDASLTFVPGDLVAHVTDEPTNRWENRDTVTSTTAGNYAAVFVSQLASSDARAPAGTLTVIADPVTGWNSITNATDATEGTDIESIEALKLRGEQGVAASASRTRGGIRAALVNVDGVLSAEVFENTTNATDANGLPPHSIRAVVWDGDPAAADDNDIAQAIYDRKAEGITSDGTEVGTAQDDDVGPVLVSFARATESVSTVAVAIESEVGVSIADVKEAILAAWPGGGLGVVGEGIKYNRITGSVFEVPGVDDWTTFTINGGTADLAGSVSTIRTLVAGGITVTGDAT